MFLGSLNFNLGEDIVIFLETLKDNARFSFEKKPIIKRIIFPNLSTASGMPQTMREIDNGLFAFKFNTPVNKNAIGSYLVELEWENGHGYYQVIVSTSSQGSLYKATAG